MGRGTYADNKMKRDLQIANDRMQGLTFRELSRKYNVSNSTISRILSKQEIQDVISDSLNHLVTFAPIIVKTYRDLLNSDNDAVRLKCAAELSKIIGISPSHAPSQINILFNQSNNNIIVSDKMREIVNKLAGNDDFIDAEFSAIIGE